MKPLIYILKKSIPMMHGTYKVNEKREVLEATHMAK